MAALIGTSDCFLFWIGSRAWWSRNCLTWWSVDVKPAAVRLGARSITAAAFCARFKLLLSGEQKNLNAINPVLRNLHSLYGFDSCFINLLMERLHWGLTRTLFGQQRLTSHSSARLWEKQNLAYTQHTPPWNTHLQLVSHAAYLLVAHLRATFIQTLSLNSLNFPSCSFKSRNSSERPVVNTLQ